MGFLLNNACEMETRNLVKDYSIYDSESPSQDEYEIMFM